MITKSFGIAVKFYRNKLNLSQEKFALQINMDRTYYASVESGKRNISLNNIDKISKGLEISLQELFSKVEEIESEK
ncbi:MAG: helix-turn-helix domain-containing protein [Tissierellales bacterium]|jgi:transcriptional regulator with XRE-family HTH domain|nr:helix-turn-helix domain-containing protein [Tissierellales bacterium]